MAITEKSLSNLWPFKRKIFIFCLFILFFLSSLATGAELADSVGALYRRTNDNSLRFTCTVSVLDWDNTEKMILITADHCVDLDQKHYLVTFDNISFQNAELYMVPRDKPDDPKVDMALLIMDKQDIPALKLDMSDDTKAGTEIATVGFPLGVAKLMYKGYVAGKVSNYANDMNNYYILQIFGAPGSSGTSVIEVSTHKIIGVLVAAQSAMVGLPVIYATPISYIQYLVTPTERRKIHRRYLEDDE